MALDIQAQAARYLPNLSKSAIENMDPEMLKLLVRRGELAERLQQLIAAGLGNSVEAIGIRDMIKLLDDILEQIRELDRKLQAAAIKAWKKSLEKGSAEREETFQILGLVDSRARALEPLARLKQISQDSPPS